MWEEIQLVSRGSQVALVENPDELEGQKKNNLFNWILPSGKIEPEMLTIGFIHAKTGATSSWTYAHELGRMHLEQVFEGKMKTMAFEQVNTEEETEKAIEDAIAAGCNTIFTTAQRWSTRVSVPLSVIRRCGSTIVPSACPILRSVPIMQECMRQNS